MSHLPKPWAEPSRRRNPTDRVLPAEGRKGRVPKWPSGHDPNPAEKAMWRRLWALPQAVAWQDTPGVSEVLERYVRVSCAVSKDLDTDGTAKAALLAQLRGLEADLGLSPVALARLRWTIEETTSSTRPPAPVRRIKAVDPPPAG